MEYLRKEFSKVGQKINGNSWIGKKSIDLIGFKDVGDVIMLATFLLSPVCYQIRLMMTFSEIGNEQVVKRAPILMIKRGKSVTNN